METRLEMKRLNILTHQSPETQTHQSLETQTHQSRLLKHKRAQRIFCLLWKDHRMPKASKQRPASDQTLETATKAFNSWAHFWKGLKVREWLGRG